jgi:hypothetical protein
VHAAGGGLDDVEVVAAAGREEVAVDVVVEEGHGAGERRKERGEKGEGRREKGEGRREKGEGRRVGSENGPTCYRVPRRPPSMGTLMPLT